MRVLVKQLWRHPPGSASHVRRAHRHADRGVAKKAREPKVSDAGRAVAVDQNVALHAIS